MRASVVLSVVSGRVSTEQSDGSSTAGQPQAPPCCDALQPCRTPKGVDVTAREAGLLVQSFKATTPVLLPPLYLVAGITVTDPRFYDLQVLPRFSGEHARALTAGDA